MPESDLYWGTFNAARRLLRAWDIWFAFCLMIVVGPRASLAYLDDLERGATGLSRWLKDERTESGS